ncbi:MAG: radical SAM protein [Candidatus Korobacteraceae bacterium]
MPVRNASELVSINVQPPRRTRKALSPGKDSPHIIRSLPVLVLNTHSRCNCRCVMCDIWKIAEARNLGVADLLPHVESIRKLGVRWVVLSGGEPLMNPGLWPLCRMLREEGIRITLLSTGLLFEKHASLIAENVDEAIVSLDGPAEVHDSIRRVKGAFEQMRDGIAAVRRHRASFPVSGRMTVQCANFRTLRQTVAAAKSLGLDSISFLAADLTSQAFNREIPWDQKGQELIALDAHEIHILEVELKALVEECALEIRNGFVREGREKLLRIARHFRAHLGMCEPEAPLCNAPWVSAVVEVDGAVRPCFFHPAVGNLRDGELEEIVNGEAAIRFREKLQVAENAVCQRCVCSLNL